MSRSTDQSLAEAMEHHRAGRLAVAEAIYRALLSRDPNQPQALALLGLIAHQVGRHEDAVKLISRAIVLAPRDPAAHNNLGEAHRAAGRLDQAIECYRIALKLQPAYAEANNNLVDALRSQRRLDDAIAQQRAYLAIAPQDADAHNDLGDMLHDAGDAVAAEHSLRRAVSLRPDSAAAHSNLGRALQTQWRHDEAIAELRAAAEREPRTYSNLLLGLNYHPRLTPAQIYDEHVRWGQRHADPLSQVVRPHANHRAAERRLRIAYVSPDFHEHPVARMIAPVLAAHDRHAVEVICYDDGLRMDAMTQRLRGAADGWISIAKLADEQFADRVRQDLIDVLVDLTGHTATNRLLAFARQPAPVQVSYLGYCNTTGMRAMQYRISDDIVDPVDASQPYTEQLVRLPGCFCCYAPAEDAPDVADRTGAVTFGSLHKLAKLNDDVLDLWAAVLSAVPQSKLLVLRHTLRGVLQERLRDAFQRRGVAPHRVDLRHELPPGGHLHAYSEIDVLLDTTPWSGHATTCEALWMGVPTIADRGDRHAGRLSSTVLHAVGLPELIASTPAQYVELARKLTDNRSTLTEMRRSMRDRLRASPLLDGRRVAAALEDAYRRMWRDWCARGERT